MKVKKSLLALTTLLVLLPIPVGLYFWNALPDPMATHFGSDGTANGYSSKGFAVFGIPLLLAAIQLICIHATAMSRRLREQNEQMQRVVLWIVPVVSLFACGMVYRFNLVGPEDVTVPMMALFGGMFVILGNLMPKIRQNAFVGIRLPWTVWGSEEVWHKTHRFSGKLWVVCGLLLLADAFLGIARVQVSICLLAAVGLVPVVYSFVVYRREKA